MRATSRHRADGGLGVAVLDQGLADQHRAGALGDVARARRRGRRCRTRRPAPGRPARSGASSAERVGVDLEGLEVAGVDADQLGAERDRALGLGLVVHLDQHGQAELAGLVVQPAQVVVVERGHDQQREVGAGRAGLEQLVAARR